MESPHIFTVLLEALKKEAHSIDAGKDQPVIEPKVANSLIQRSPTGGRNYFNSGELQALGPFSFQQDTESTGLLSRPSYHHCFAKQWPFFEPVEMLAQPCDFPNHNDGGGLDPSFPGDLGNTAKRPGDCLLFCSRTPTNDCHWGFRCPAVLHQLRTDELQVSHSHEKDQGAHTGGQSVPVDVGLLLSWHFMSGNKGHRGRQSSVGQRNTCISRHSDR